MKISMLKSIFLNKKSIFLNRGRQKGGVKNILRRNYDLEANFSSKWMKLGALDAPCHFVSIMVYHRIFWNRGGGEPVFWFSAWQTRCGISRGLWVKNMKYKKKPQRFCVLGESVRRIYYHLLCVHYVRTAPEITLDVYSTRFMCTWMYMRCVPYVVDLVRFVKRIYDEVSYWLGGFQVKKAIYPRI